MICRWHQDGAAVPQFGGMLCHFSESQRARILSVLPTAKRIGDLTSLHSEQSSKTVH